MRFAHRRPTKQKPPPNNKINFQDFIWDEEGDKDNVAPRGKKGRKKNKGKLANADVEEDEDDIPLTRYSIQ